MKIQLLNSSFGPAQEEQYATCYLLNDTIAIDAGPLGLWGNPQQQSAVRHIFLTHTHIDHIATLPIFLENVWDPEREAVVLHGYARTLQDFRAHILNDIIWPDFVRISSPGSPFLKLHELKAEEICEVEGLQILPVAVDHTVPTFGYIITDGQSTIVMGADSHSTDRIWKLAWQMPEPRSVFLEASFPNSMRKLAEITRHLTPEMFAGEVKKMPTMRNIFAVHLKARFRETVLKELGSLGIAGLVIAESGITYEL
jgi:ribonuclease BN (tRNA processing enzyme)